VPTTIRSNKATLLLGIARAYYPGRGGPPPIEMPRSWTYMMAVLIVCLVASMVIAAIRLL
jgi:hypothetical protein